MNTIVIIPAGGAGKRFGGDIPKQYQEIAGAPVIIHTLRIFESIEEISGIILAVAPGWKNFLHEQKEKFSLKKIFFFAEAGAERQHTIYNALRTNEARDAEIILVHDAVRPLAGTALTKKIISSAREFGAAIPALPLKETVKKVDKENFVLETPARNFLRAVQTPQGFRKEILLAAYEHAQKENFLGTDDASLVEYAGYPVKVIEGEEKNIKLTTEIDRQLAEIFLR